MKISIKQYELDEADPTLEQLQAALLQRGYQIGEVQEGDEHTRIWSLETTSPAQLNVPLCTIEWDCMTGLCQLVEFEKEPEDEEGECPGCPDCCPDCGSSSEIEEEETQASFIEVSCFISSVVSGTAAALVKPGDSVVTWFDDDDEQVLAGVSLREGELAVYISHNVDMKSFLAIRGYCNLLNLAITKTWPAE